MVPLLGYATGIMVLEPAISCCMNIFDDCAGCFTWGERFVGLLLH